MQHQTRTEPEPRSHAVVIGGSMAGLLATRVLRDFYDRVTLVERDRLPDGPDARKGLPRVGTCMSFWFVGSARCSNCSRILIAS